MLDWSEESKWHMNLLGNSEQVDLSVCGPYVVVMWSVKAKNTK